MARKKVYVSSTFKDLEEHRSAVKATLERAGFDVGCMEKYPAFDERPKDKCLADVAECDYYVLILAWRYGFQPEDDNPRRLSITHLEYEEAVRLKSLVSHFYWTLMPPGSAAFRTRIAILQIRRFADSATTSKNAMAGVSTPLPTASPAPSMKPFAQRSRNI